MNFPHHNPTFIIKTLGCKVNQYESELMRQHLLRNGYNESGTPELADIYIVNSGRTNWSKEPVGVLHISLAEHREGHLIGKQQIKGRAYGPDISCAGGCGSHGIWRGNLFG